MNNPSVKFMALKYLRGRGRGLIGKTHYLTLAGIALGVMALICVSSVMNGFQADMENRLISSQSEMRLYADGQQELREFSSLQFELEKEGFASSPVIRAELMLKVGNQIAPTLAFGVDPRQHSKVSRLFQPARTTGENLEQGILTGRVDSLSTGEGGIVLGVGLAYQMQLVVGDKVQVLSPIFSEPTAFGMIPKIRSLKVLAIVSSGMPEYDQSHSYIPLATAAYFKGYTEGVDYLEIKTPDRNKVRAYNHRLKKLFPKHQIEDWSQFDPSLFTAMRFEKFLMIVIMLFMYIIASFNLTGNMLKTISLKKRELGLLKALGYQETELSRLFLHQAMILSTIGIALGFLLALLLLWLQMSFGLIQLPVSEFESIGLPIKIELPDLLLVLIISYALTLASTMIPLGRLKQINAVELLRQTV
ncbi:MAG TPA: ABC transporter permease [Candidatus Cloacimonadota bacterium]|nr:ABC transporter permease [Candidatus Cloacimonadota bacterium]